MKYREDQQFFYIFPDKEDQEDTLTITVCQANGLESEACIRMYLYIDDNFAAKSKIFQASSTPQLDFGIDLNLPSDAEKIIIEFFDCSDTDMALGNTHEMSQLEEEDDEDKVLFSYIGRSEIAVDKILTNLLVNNEDNEYETWKKIIYIEGDDSFESGVYSTGSTKDHNTKLQPAQALYLTKGRTQLLFMAAMTPNFYDRTETLR